MVGVRVTHVVLSELIQSDLGLHEVVVQDDDLATQHSVLLLVVLGLPTQHVILRSRESDIEYWNKTAIKFRQQQWMRGEPWRGGEDGRRFRNGLG